MRKKMLFLMIVIVLIIVVLFIMQNCNSSQKRIVTEVSNNYEMIMKSVDVLLNYEPDDSFYIADNDDVSENPELIKGEVYKESSFKETIINESIKKSLDLKYVTRIQVSQKIIDFEWDEAVLDNRDNGVVFAGFYYSLNGNPQIASFLENEELRKDGNGWSYIDDQKMNSYYTEIIKDQIYYYKGVFYP